MGSFVTKLQLYTSIKSKVTVSPIPTSPPQPCPLPSLLSIFPVLSLCVLHSPEGTNTSLSFFFYKKGYALYNVDLLILKKDLFIDLREREQGEGRWKRERVLSPPCAECGACHGA